jgi:hypothetical protein
VGCYLSPQSPPPPREVRLPPYSHLQLNSPSPLPPPLCPTYLSSGTSGGAEPTFTPTLPRQHHPYSFLSPLCPPPTPPLCPTYLSSGTSGGADPPFTPTVSILMPSAANSGIAARVRPGTSLWWVGGWVGLWDLTGGGQGQNGGRTGSKITNRQ